MFGLSFNRVALRSLTHPAAYAVGAAHTLPVPALTVLAFTALVVGNLGLIVRHRPRGSLLQTLQLPTTASVVITGLALTALLPVTRLGAVASWFGFSPLPLSDWLLAVSLPVVAVVLMKVVRRKHQKTGPTQGPIPRHPEMSG